MDLTIIIPTKNRLFFLERLLNYYKNSKYKGHLIIIDSSETNIFSEQKKLINSYTNLSAKHVYSKYTPLHATKEYVDLIKTNYVTFSGDDDYHHISGLNSCINFLDENKKISSARGKAYLFELNKLDNEIQTIYDYDSYNFLDSNAVKRFKKFMQHPRSITQNVWKTSIFKKSFNQLLEYEKIYLCPDRYFYDEILLTSLLLVNGKIKIIDETQFIMTLNSRRLKDRNKWQKLDMNMIDKSIDYTAIKISEVIKINDKSNATISLKDEIKSNLKNFIYNKYVPAVKKDNHLTIRKLIIYISKKIEIYNFLKLILRKKNKNINNNLSIRKECKEIINSISGN